MSLDQDADFVAFFLDGKADEALFETLEFSHSNFSKTYRFVRNAASGITATLEDLSVVTFDYLPMLIKSIGSRDNLDSAYQITFGDVGEVLPTEFDLIAAASGFGEKPIIKYRAYKSNDLTSPLYGPLILEGTSFSFDRQGAQFEASAPSLNINETGESYTTARFPMLRGFL